MEISTSILSVKKENAIETFYRLEMAHTDYFHIDVMDGEFVEKDTSKLMQTYSENLKNITNIPLDVHLMVKDVKRYVDIFASCNPRNIYFHIEAMQDSESTINKENITKQENIKEINESAESFSSINEKSKKMTVKEMINYIKELDCKVGLAISPETKVEEIYEYLPFIHNVLVMTVVPGKGGQELITDTITKIRSLREYAQKNSIDIEIEADGGINVDNIAKIKDAGADIAVVGSYIINSKDYKYTIDKLKKV